METTSSSYINFKSKALYDKDVKWGSEKPAVALCVHQDECGIYDVARCAGRLLKNGGRLWLCYPASRLAECFHAMVESRLQPKRLRLIDGKNGPYLALMECVKGGKTGLIIERN